MSLSIEDLLTKCGIVDEATREQCEKYLKIFEDYDTDGNGELSRDELTDLVVKKGKTKEQANKYFNYCDVNNDGKISKEEFLKALAGFSVEDQFMRICADFDADGNGYIDTSELRAILCQCGFQNESEEVLQRFIDELDVNGDGKLEYHEFINGFLKNKLA